MAGDRAGKTRAVADGGRPAFNALWLLDAAGLAAAGGFAWLVAASPALPAGLDPVLAREAALALAGVAAIVRIVDFRGRRRARRSAARGELLRRLVALDDSLMDLRRSLSRDAARRFVERRIEFAAGLEETRKALSEGDAGQAYVGLGFCTFLTESLTGAVQHRAAAASMTYRVQQEIARAGRRGEIAAASAEELSALAADALAVMDEGLYAEWNADHFGRLAAIEASFQRILERHEGEVIGQIARQAEGLFGQVLLHLRDKVEVVDALRGWTDVRRRLEFTLADVRASVRRPPMLAPEAPRLAERFVVATGSPYRAEAPLTPVRLPAAND